MVDSFNIQGGKADTVAFGRISLRFLFSGHAIVYSRGEELCQVANYYVDTFSLLA